MKYLLTLAILLTSLLSYSQLIGEITSDDEPSGQPAVSIRVIGIGIVTTSDFDGNYKLDIEDGEYDLVFSFISYKTDTVHIVIDGDIKYNHVMKSQSLELEGVSVIYKVNRESENILLIDRKKTTLKEIN